MLFNDWLLDLKDNLGRQKIRIRLGRLALGNFGDCKNLKDNVSELRIAFGPGYRIYFAYVTKSLILVLCAGTKRTQQKDIEKAKKYLIDYKMRE